MACCKGRTIEELENLPHLIFTGVVGQAVHDVLLDLRLPRNHVVHGLHRVQQVCHAGVCAHLAFKCLIADLARFLVYSGSQVYRWQTSLYWDCIRAFFSTSKVRTHC
jgi:hypothetical protein